MELAGSKCHPFWQVLFPRAGKNYAQKKFKIVTPILIKGFAVGLFPFGNGAKLW